MVRPCVDRVRQPRVSGAVRHVRREARRTLERRLGRETRSLQGALRPSSHACNARRIALGHDDAQLAVRGNTGTVSADAPPRRRCSCLETAGGTLAARRCRGIPDRLGVARIELPIALSGPLVAVRFSARCGGRCIRHTRIRDDLATRGDAHQRCPGDVLDPEPAAVHGAART